MTTKQALILGNQKLKTNHIDSAYLDAEILLSFILKQNKEFIYTHPEHSLTSSQIKKINQLIAHRVKGKPVAYLIGHKNFYGFDFIVNKNVLIPRPETELVVDSILTLIKNKSASKYILIDVGTGSGCIPIALAKNLRQLPNIKYYGLDISDSALKVAKRNAQIHDLAKKIKFIKSDLLKNIFNTKYLIPNAEIIVSANLPYLSTKQYLSNPDLKYEPKQALIAGSDGLKYYRQLIKQIKTLISYTSSIVIFLEIDPAQTATIKKVIHSHLPKAHIAVQKDLSRRNRLIVINLNYKMKSHSH